MRMMRVTRSCFCGRQSRIRNVAKVCPAAWFSDHAVSERFSSLEKSEVVKEVPRESGELLGTAAGGVGGNEAVRQRPEGMVRRERFGVGDVEVNSAQPAGSKRFHQRGL